MVWSTKLNDIIVAVGFQVYDTEIKAQYVLTKEDSTTSDIVSKVESNNSSNRNKLKNRFPLFRNRIKRYLYF